MGMVFVRVALWQGWLCEGAPVPCQSPQSRAMGAESAGVLCMMLGTERRRLHLTTPESDPNLERNPSVDCDGFLDFLKGLHASKFTGNGIERNLFIAVFIQCIFQEFFEDPMIPSIMP